MDRFGLGQVFKTRFERGVLKAEGWFDVDVVRKNDPALLSELEQGKVLEISTGLFTTDTPVENGIHTDGRPYKFVARQYVPDHLAVLGTIGQRGACSVDDGCGVNANADKATENQTVGHAKCVKKLKDGEEYEDCTGVNDPAKQTNDKPVKNDDKKDNTFCATGEGGGIDPSCGKGDADGETSKAVADSLASHIASGALHEPQKFRDSYSNLEDADKKATVKDLAKRGLIHPVDARKRGVMIANEVVKSARRQFEKLKLDHISVPTNRYIPFEDSDAYKKLTGNTYQSQPHSSDTGKFKAPNAGTGKSDTRDAALLGTIELTPRHHLLGMAAQAEERRTGSNPPKWVTDPGKWAKAKDAARKSGCSDFYACTTAIYENMGGGVAHKGKRNSLLTPTPTVNTIRKQGGKFCVYSESGKKLGEYATRAEAEKRLRQIEYFKHKKDNTVLTGNNCGIGEGGFQGGNTCAKGGGGGGGKAGKGKSAAPKLTKKALSSRATDLLRKASDADKAGKGDDARRYRAAAHGYNRAAKHLEDGNKASAKAVMKTAGEFESGARSLKKNASDHPEGLTMFETRKDAEQYLLTANCSCMKGKADKIKALDDDTVVNLANDAQELEQAREAVLVVNALHEEFKVPDETTLNEMPAFIKKKVAAKSAKEDPDDDSDAADDDDDEYPKKNQRGRTAVDSDKKQSMEQWLKTAPDQVVAAFQAAEAVRANSENELIASITANMSAEDKKTAEPDLRKRTVEDLQKISRYVRAGRPTANTTQQPRQLTVYHGAGATGIPTANAGDDFKPRGMEFPTVNWAEEKKILDAQQKGVRAG